MRGRRPASFLAGGAVVLVALLAAYAGPVQIGDPVIPFDRLELAFPEDESDQDETSLFDGEEPEFEANPLTIGVLVFGLIVGAIALVVAVMALAWAVRRLRTLRWKPRPREIEDDYDVRIDEALTAAAGEAAHDVDAVLPGMATDAVIACWVRLERAAAEADTPRFAHQTPSEFTAALLAEHHADASAVAELLEMYHRARFGATPLPDEAATHAARALRRIGATLRPRLGPGERIP